MKATAPTWKSFLDEGGPMKVYRRVANVMIVCLLAVGLAPALSHAQQETAETLKSVEAALATRVTGGLVREFTFCELRAAAWGRYDVAVRVGKDAALDGQPRIFQIIKGNFSQKADPDTSVKLAKVEGRGDVVFANKEEAFARGVPFFISDASLASTTELNYTVHSNPAIPVEKAYFMLEFRKEYLSGTSLEVPQPLSSKPEPQARNKKLSDPIEPKDKNRFEIATELENHQGCLVSNTIDLNALLKESPSK
jgi:hypothetical protein